jgi:hypothetical protein
VLVRTSPQCCVPAFPPFFRMRSSCQSERLCSGGLKSVVH